MHCWPGWALGQPSRKQPGEWNRHAHAGQASKLGLFQPNRGVLCVSVPSKEPPGPHPSGKDDAALLCSATSPPPRPPCGKSSPATALNLPTAPIGTVQAVSQLQQPRLPSLVSPLPLTTPNPNTEAKSSTRLSKRPTP